MDRRIVERDRELVELTHLVRQAGTGAGQVVLVFGEAGIGKSRLVEAMGARMPAVLAKLGVHSRVEARQQAARRLDAGGDQP